MPDQPTSLSPRVPNTHRSHRLLAAGVLVACLLITFAAWAMVRREVERAGQQRFDSLTGLVRNGIREPVREPQRVLESLPGRIGSSDPVVRDRWGESLATTVLGVGTVFSLLAATLTWSLGITRSRGRAIQLADNLNDDLRRQILALAAEAKARRAAEMRLQTFVEHTPAAVAMLDREMRYLATSRRWLSEYRIQADNLVGCCLHEVFPNHSAPWQAVYERCLAGATETSHGDRWRPPGWEEDQIVRWEIRPWFNASGTVGGLMMFTQDISEVAKPASATDSPRSTSSGGAKVTSTM